MSHWQLKYRQITDPDWHSSCVRLAERSDATIVPVYFHGNNSWYFQFAGIISPYLRTLLLPKQFFAKQHQQIHIEIGKSISVRPSKIIDHWFTKETDFNTVNNLVKDIERDRKGIPILFKQYQKMGMKFFGFGIDNKFNNSTDCLGLIYVKDIPLNKKRYYMDKSSKD